MPHAATTDKRASARPRRDLSNLESVVLTPPHRHRLAMASAMMNGALPWRHRKLAEGHTLLALAQQSGRFRVEFLDLTDAIRALITMRVPVACLPNPAGSLQIESQATLGLVYPESAMRSPSPGYEFIELLRPLHAWYPNLAQPVQRLCLGAAWPAGLGVKELMLAAFGALTMQTVQLDPGDAAGVLNPRAAAWWQANVARLPLTRESFACAEVNP